MTIAPGVPPRPVRDHRQARRGRHGRGLARDATRSSRREVAIKVLPAAFAARPGAPRALRARGAAPRLAQPPEHRLDLRPRGVATATRALVMELVEGEDLAERLDARAAPARRGARHRAPDRRGARGGAREGDRPPRPQARRTSRSRRTARSRSSTSASPRRWTAGGLASAADLARSPTLMNSPTMTAAHGTQLGVILGTAAYMAPEQARGSAGRQARRHLGVRRRPLRDADGAAALRRRDGRRHARRRAQARDRPRDAARRDAARDRAACCAAASSATRRAASTTSATRGSLSTRSGARPVGQLRGPPAAPPKRRPAATSVLAGSVALGAIFALGGARFLAPPAPRGSARRRPVRLRPSRRSPEGTRAVALLSPDGRQSRRARRPRGSGVRRLDQLAPRRHASSRPGERSIPGSRVGRLVVRRRDSTERRAGSGDQRRRGRRRRLTAGAPASPGAAPGDARPRVFVLATRPSLGGPLDGGERRLTSPSGRRRSRATGTGLCRTERAPLAESSRGRIGGVEDSGEGASSGAPASRSPDRGPPTPGTPSRRAGSSGTTAPRRMGQPSSRARQSRATALPFRFAPYGTLLRFGRRARLRSGRSGRFARRRGSSPSTGRGR